MARAALKLDAPRAAVKVTDFGPVTVCVWMLENETLVWPESTVTLAGKVRYGADAAGTDRDTTSPSAGAARDKVTFELAELPPSTAPGVTVKPVSVQPTLTVRASGVVLISSPLVPVMVIGEVPTAAVSVAVSVITVESVDDVGLNDAVTPAGSPETE